MREFLKKGQITITVAIIGAVGVLGGSIVTSWATVSASIWGVEARVDVIEEREGNHFQELSKKMDNLENKIDRILEANIKK